MAKITKKSMVSNLALEKANKIKELLTLCKNAEYNKTVSTNSVSYTRNAETLEELKKQVLFLVDELKRDVDIII